MKFKAFWLVSALAFLLGPVSAQASSKYLSAFNTTYGTSGTRLDTCILCHPTVPSLNPYGTDFRAYGHIFSAIEPLDSDGDGYSNIDEILALTFPGDPADTPPTAPFQAAGTDFQRCTPSGCPGWKTLSGSWTGRQGLFSSSALFNNAAIISGPPALDGFTTGRIEAGIMLNESAPGVQQNATVIFGFVDSSHFRYATFEPDRILIGQAGDYAGEVDGIKTVQNISYGLDVMRQVRLDILETGDLNVYVDQEGDAAPAAAYSFRSPVAGKIGCHAGQAKSFYLNFTVWGEAELPAEPEAE